MIKFLFSSVNFLYCLFVKIKMLKISYYRLSAFNWDLFLFYFLTLESEYFSADTCTRGTFCFAFSTNMNTRAIIHEIPLHRRIGFRGRHLGESTYNGNFSISRRGVLHASCRESSRDSIPRYWQLSSGKYTLCSRALSHSLSPINIYWHVNIPIPLVELPWVSTYSFDRKTNTCSVVVDLAMYQWTSLY